VLLWLSLLVAASIHVVPRRLSLGLLHFLGLSLRLSLGLCLGVVLLLLVLLVLLVLKLLTLVR